MATRYSGALKIDVRWIEAHDVSPHKRLQKARHCPHNGYYRVSIFGPSGVKIATQSVCAPAHLTHGVDSPEAYDEAAGAAISFTETAQDYAAYNEDGWRHVGRTKERAWGLAAGSTKKRLMQHHASRRGGPVVYVEEREVDAEAYGITPKEAETGAEMHFTMSGPKAALYADRMQSLGGSSWENDGPAFAYNIVTVWSDKERKDVLDELHQAGASVFFEGTSIPSRHEQRLRARAQRIPGASVEYNKRRYTYGIVKRK